jgi:predicted HAD superfamily Cof-like phosphohydrolase
MMMQDKTDVDKVAEFNKVFGLSGDVEQKRNDVNGIDLRVSLLLEEVSEYIREMENAKDEIKEKGSISKETLIRMTAENADIRYILAGDADVLGLPTDLAFNRIHVANMRKVGPDGKVRRRADGKVLKPDDWKPAKFDDLF